VKQTISATVNRIENVDISTFLLCSITPVYNCFINILKGKSECLNCAILTTFIIHHSSLLHSRLKTFLSANPSNHSLPFLLQDWLHGFPALFTDTSKRIRFLVFLFSTF